MAEYCARVENQLSIHKIDFRGINTNRPGNNLIDMSHLLEIIYIYFLGGILEIVYSNAIVTYQMNKLRLKDVTSLLS